jgi:hypothetical protein
MVYSRSSIAALPRGRGYDTRTFMSSETRGRQLGLPIAAHTVLDMEALRQTALSSYAVSKRAVALCAVCVFLDAPPEERDAWMQSLIPAPSMRPFRSLELPIDLHLAIELEAVRLSDVLGAPITKGVVVAAAAEYYQHLPESTRPIAGHRAPRRDQLAASAARKAGS